MALFEAAVVVVKVESLLTFVAGPCPRACSESYYSYRCGCGDDRYVQRHMCMRSAPIYFLLHGLGLVPYCMRVQCAQ